MSETLSITRLGHRGDGIGQAAHDAPPHYVPFTLPGEDVKVAGDGSRKRLIEILTPSPQRIEPICKYFGHCGGCQLQHLEHKAYLDWKCATLKQELEKTGISTPLEPALFYPPSSRRRVVLSAKIIDQQWQLGFAQRASHQLVDIDACAVLLPQLQESFAPLRDILRLLGGYGMGHKQAVRIMLLKAINGTDCSLQARGKITNRLVEDLARNSAARHFLRISLNGETVYEQEKPLIKTGTAFVCPPPEAFCQAVEDAEKDMAGLVCQHLGKSKRVMDLFCGYGSFALRLAENSMVHASDNEANALLAMDRAWRETGGKLKSLTHEKRNLFRQPFMAAELKKFDGLVFDPPRSGAFIQAKEIAKSKIRRLAAVSCNLQTLSQDLRLLVEGGFNIVSITPIDQFAFTPHLETVVLLER